MKEISLLIRLGSLYLILVLSLHFWFFRDARSAYITSDDLAENMPLAYLVNNSAAMDGVVTSATYRVCDIGGLPYEVLLVKSFVVTDGTHKIRVVTRGPVPSVGQRLRLTATFQQQANGQLLRNWCILQETEPELREYQEVQTRLPDSI